jgi:hypothetical protein
MHAPTSTAKPRSAPRDTAEPAPVTAKVNGTLIPAILHVAAAAGPLGPSPTASADAVLAGVSLTKPVSNASAPGDTAPSAPSTVSVLGPPIPAALHVAAAASPLLPTPSPPPRPALALIAPAPTVPPSAAPGDVATSAPSTASVLGPLITAALHVTAPAGPLGPTPSPPPRPALAVSAPTPTVEPSSAPGDAAPSVPSTASVLGPPIPAALHVAADAGPLGPTPSPPPRPALAVTAPATTVPPRAAPGDPAPSAPLTAKALGTATITAPLDVAAAAGPLFTTSTLGPGPAMAVNAPTTLVKGWEAPSDTAASAPVTALVTFIRAITAGLDVVDPATTNIPGTQPYLRLALALIAITTTVTSIAPGFTVLPVTCLQGASGLGGAGGDFGFTTDWFFRAPVAR